MVLRRYERRAAVIDGLGDEAIEVCADDVVKRIAKLMKHIEPRSLAKHYIRFYIFLYFIFRDPKYTRINLSHWKRLVLRMSKCELGLLFVPQQKDSWSCGFRTILVAQALLNSGSGLLSHDEAWLKPMEDFEIEDHDVSEKAMLDLAKRWDEITRPVKPKAEVVPAPFNHVKREGHVKVERLLRPVATPCRALPREPEAVPAQAAAAAGAADPNSSTSPSPPCEKPAAPTDAGSDEKTDSAEAEQSFEEALTKGVMQVLENRTEQQALRRDEKLAKKILAKAGVRFNEEFQKQHCARLEKGHWQNFLAAVIGTLHKRSDNNLNCLICRNLIASFDVPRAAATIAAEMDRQKGKPSEPTGPLPEPVDAAAGDGVIVPHVPVEGGEDCVPVEPACKKARRGRPPKGEKSDFNLLNFLESDRSGQYKRLSEEEA